MIGNDSGWFVNIADRMRIVVTGKFKKPQLTG